MIAIFMRASEPSNRRYFKPKTILRKPDLSWGWTESDIRKHTPRRSPSGGCRAGDGIRAPRRSPVSACAPFERLDGLEQQSRRFLRDTVADTWEDPLAGLGNQIEIGRAHV